MADLTEINALREKATGVLRLADQIQVRIDETQRQIQARLVTAGELMNPDDAAAGEPDVPSLDQLDAYILELEASCEGKAAELKERAEALSAELATLTSESPS